MIIDEICEQSRKYQTNNHAKLDLRYIYDMAVIDKFPEIVWAIAYYWKMKDSDANSVVTRARYNIIDALAHYIDDSDYNKDLKKYLEVLV